MLSVIRYMPFFLLKSCLRRADTAVTASGKGDQDDFAAMAGKLHSNEVVLQLNLFVGYKYTYYLGC